MIHPNTELRFIRPEIGWGVVATRLIPRGTIVWTIDSLDQCFTIEEAAALPPYAQKILDVYAYTDRFGRFVLCWDHGRFVNHSCDANCLSVGYDFELAVRDIAAGEELCDDYGTLTLSEPFPCSCGRPGCRGSVLPGDHVRLAREWNETARGAFFLIPAVAQPLWDVLRNDDRNDVTAALQNPSLMRPIDIHFAGASVRNAEGVTS